MGRMSIRKMALMALVACGLAFVLFFAYVSPTAGFFGSLIVAGICTAYIAILLGVMLAVAFLRAEEGMSPGRIRLADLSFDARAFLGGWLSCAAGMVVLEYLVPRELHAVLAPAIGAVVVLSMVSLWVAVRIRRRWEPGRLGLPRLVISLAMAGISAAWCMLVARDGRVLRDSLMLLSILLIFVYIGAWSLRLLSVTPSAFHKHWPAREPDAAEAEGR